VRHIDAPVYPQRMKATRAIVALSVTLLLAGCASVPAVRSEPAVSSTRAEAPVENPNPPTPGEVSDAPAPVVGTDARVKSRALMDSEARQGAETQFLEFLESEGPVASFSDAQLVRAGNDACDAMDRNESVRSVVSAAVASLQDPPGNAGFIIFAFATGSLCPEHGTYLADHD
jgi:hypothetical protein